MSDPSEGRPRVAVVGASADPEKWSNKSLRAHAACGYEVLPIHPRGGEIGGLRVYPSLREAPPGRLERVTLYVPPGAALAVLDEVAERGCDELWLNPGVDAPEVVARAQELGLPVIQACSLVDCQDRLGP